MDAQRFRQMLWELSRTSVHLAPEGTIAVLWSHLDEGDLGAVRRWVESTGGHVAFTRDPDPQPYFVIAATTLHGLPT